MLFAGQRRYSAAIGHGETNVRLQLLGAGALAMVRAPGNIGARYLISIRTMTAVALESHRYGVALTEWLPHLQFADRDVFVLNRKEGDEAHRL